ncbi:hypothetical protein BDV24DRAFT_169294 [Aspergillus arachidicola]|uniref:Uncharacterized protein n=1 Tax=Aspergillus arachidicola TaxID=656916 RepID=A0A5N6XQV6_9EURO|nr:hypothetical protein BDV24DRAFT_169294 [Aspergillus arachidicola]
MTSNVAEQPVICVFCGAQTGELPDYMAAARALALELHNKNLGVTIRPICSPRIHTQGLRDLPVPPPVSLADSKDQQVFDAIRALGTRSQAPQEEVEKACCLAAGPADFTILLERPAPNHDYADDFEKFVRSCLR